MPFGALFHIGPFIQQIHLTKVVFVRGDLGDVHDLDVLPTCSERVVGGGQALDEFFDTEPVGRADQQNDGFAAQFPGIHRTLDRALELGVLVREDGGNIVAHPFPEWPPLRTSAHLGARNDQKSEFVSGDHERMVYKHREIERVRAKRSKNSYISLRRSGSGRGFRRCGVRSMVSGVDPSECYGEICHMVCAVFFAEGHLTPHPTAPLFATYAAQSGGEPYWADEW